MNIPQKPKMSKSKETRVLFIILSIGLIFSFFLFQPKLSSKLFPIKRIYMWKVFINKVNSDKKIDPQEYWKFREFYSPGYFLFKREGLNKQLVTDNIRLIYSNLNTTYIYRPFLKYNSPLLSSLDMLVNSNKITDFINFHKIPGRKILYKDGHSIIYALGDSNIKIIFLLPLAQMQKVVGLFDYRDQDKELVKKNYSWLNITDIKIKNDIVLSR